LICIKVAGPGRSTIPGSQITRNRGEE